MKRVLCLIIMLFIPFAAYAEEEIGYFSLESAVMTENAVEVVLHSDKLTSATADALTIRLDGNAVTDYSLARTDESALFTSYVLLVDCSSAMTSANVADAKEVARLLISHMKREDNAIVITPGHIPTQLTFTSDQTALNTAIDELTRGGKRTDLYSSIKQSVSYLKNASQAHQARCLIILSNGYDNGTTGVDEQELTTMISQESFPVHVVAIVDDRNRSSEVRAARTLLSFARASGCGAEVTVGMDKTTNEAAALEVIARMKETWLVTLPITPMNAGTHELSVALAGETQTFSDTIRFQTTANAADGDSGAEPDPEPKPEPTSIPAPDPAPIPDPDLSPNLTWILIGLGAVVVITLCALIVVKRRHNARANEKPITDTPPITGEQDATPIKAVEETEPEDEVVPTLVDEDLLPHPGIHISLTEVGQGGQSYSFDVVDNLRIGRDPKKNDLSFDDHLLSAKHCVLEMLRGTLYLRDLGSTNGTQLNGVPITQPVPLTQDDNVIRVGRMSLRVTWYETKPSNK